jgi:DNA-binding PadR family transcriptional regulator
MSKIKKQYAYYTARNKKKLEVLVPLAGNWKYALVLDQLSYWSINSNYILPKESKPSGWFCMKYSDMKSELGYSEQSLYSIFKKFESAGLIERIRKKIKGDTRTCIRITHKLLNCIGLAKQNGDSYLQRNKTANDKQAAEVIDSCSERKQKYSSKTPKNRVAYKEDIENNYENKINNITFSDSSKAVDNKLDSYKCIFNQVGERLEEVQKKYIATVIENLKRDHGLKLSLSNKELFAELTFALLNKAFMPTAKTFKHRMSILSKLLREGRWSTPKGFYKYSDLGQSIAEKKAINKARYEAEKKEACGDARYKSETANSFNKQVGWGDKLKKVCETPSLKKKHMGLVHKLSAVTGELKQLSKLANYQAILKPQQEKLQAQKNALLADIEVVKSMLLSAKKVKLAENTDGDIAIYEQWGSA